MSVNHTTSNTETRNGKKPYAAPTVRTYGSIREITQTTVPFKTDKKDSGAFKSGASKTLIPR